MRIAINNSVNGFVGNNAGSNGTVTVDGFGSVWFSVGVNVGYSGTGTLDIQKVFQTVTERGYNPPQPPNIARDGRWLLQLYDKNFTRTEMMVRKPVQTPCCSPNPMSSTTMRVSANCRASSRNSNR